MGIYSWMLLTVALLAPFLLVWFTRRQPEHRLRLRDAKQAILENHYWVHLLTFFAMAAFKSVTDALNDPLKPVVGDYTSVVYGIEGAAALSVQRLFEWPVLTAALNFHYLFIYLFLILFTPLYYIYSRDRDMADKAVLNHIVVYVLAVPLYLFYNVEVTSQFIPGMKALLYHHSAPYFAFFATNDPLDNAVPSLHIAIPAALLMIHWLHRRSQGVRLAQWRHAPYDRFVRANTFVFGFSIIYLGIHWFVDIAAGLLLALVAALFVHAVQPRLRNIRTGTPIARPVRRAARNTAWTACMAAVLFLPLFAVQAEPIDVRDSPNMQLAPGEVNVDAVAPSADGEPVRVVFTNQGDEAALEALLVRLDDAQFAMEGGRVNWTLLADGGDVVRVAPRGSAALATQEEGWHALVVRDPRPAVEDDDFAAEPASARVDIHYTDAFVPAALALSVPSTLTIAFVVNRQFRLRKAEQPWYSDRPVA